MEIKIDISVTTVSNGYIFEFKPDIEGIDAVSRIVEPEARLTVALAGIIQNKLGNYSLFKYKKSNISITITGDESHGKKNRFKNSD